MPFYNTILFDADGTLLDFKAAEKNALEATLRYIGVEPTEVRSKKASLRSAALRISRVNAELSQTVPPLPRNTKVCFPSREFSLTVHLSLCLIFTELRICT